MIADSKKRQPEKTVHSMHAFNPGLLIDAMNEAGSGTIILNTLHEGEHAVDFVCVFNNFAAIDLLGKNITGKKLTALCLEPVYCYLLTECQSAAHAQAAVTRVIEWRRGAQTIFINCRIMPRQEYVFCYLDQIQQADKNEVMLPFAGIEQLLKDILGASREIIILLRCLRNEKRAVNDFKILLTNQAAENFLNRSDLKNKKLGEEYPDLKDGPIWNNNIRALRAGSASAEGSLGSHRKMMFTSVAILEQFIVLSATPEIPSSMADEEQKKMTEHLVNRITHDIKNPLSAISLAAQIVEENLQTNIKTNIIPMFTIIGRNARKIEQLLGQFLHAGEKPPEPTRADICNILESALDKASDHIVLHGCEIERTLPRGFFVTGNTGELMTAFLNIIIAAIESTEIKKGHLSVAVFHHADKVIVLFKSNGRGIHATGSLSASRNILQLHDAVVTLASDPDGGTFGL